VVARPRYVDPATLGPRQIAGYFARFDWPREYTDRGTGYTETLEPFVFDDELALYGADNPWPVQWDHGMDALTGDDPDQLTTVPIGRSLTVDPDAYGPFTVVELRPGPLADEVLAAARAGDVGFSYHGTELAPGVTEQRDGRLFVVRRKMMLREITLTGRPAEPGARVLAVGGAARALVPDLGDIQDLDVAGVNRAVDALFALTGHSRHAAELRVMQERPAREAAQRRQAAQMAGQARLLALAVTSGHRKAARLRDEAVVEAGRWPQDPHRSSASLIAEAIVAEASARLAGTRLRELCVNDEQLVADVLREAQGV
jgi:phage head maturation protease